jgi:predicted DNA-binding transcriptional regulator AlpA
MRFEEDLIRMKDLIKFFEVTRRTINLWMKDPRFPRPFRIGRENFWKRSEIEEYIEKCRK